MSDSAVNRSAGDEPSAEALSGAREDREAPVVLALDAEGGDNAPDEIVAGALAVASPSLRILVVGRPAVLRPLLGIASPHTRDHVEVVESRDVIASDEEPARAIRAKPRSSISVGAQLVADGHAHGFVSAGNTGAMLAAGLLLVKRIRGVKRPAIVTILPGMAGPVVFLDAGANADCRAEHLLEFGVLGSVFARRALGIRQPRVGLLNIGEEPSKGNELALESHRMLAESDLNFCGNVEGRDLLFNDADVVVTDGFTGNVALKLLEGTAKSILLRIREAATSDVRSKAGGLLLKPALARLRADLDPEAYGGTYLLGVRGLMVICHGNSSSKAIANAMVFGAMAVRERVVEAVADEITGTADRTPEA